MSARQNSAQIPGKMPDSTPCFMNLPTEISLMIVDCLGSWDRASLRALRLTCRFTNNMVGARIFHKHIRMRLNKDDIDDLFRVTRNESFASSVRLLTIDYECFDTRRLETAASMTSEQRSQYANSGCIFDYESPKALERIQAQVERLKLAAITTEDGEYGTMLRGILSNLRNHLKLTLNVTLYDGCCQRHCPEPSPQTSEIAARTKLQGAAAALPIALRAIKRSKVRLAGFSIFSGNVPAAGSPWGPQIGISSNALDASLQLLNHARSVSRYRFSQLRKLDIALSSHDTFVTPNMALANRTGSDNYDGLVELLQQMPKLVVLKIRYYTTCAGGQPNNLMKTLAEHCRLPSLRHLVISGLQCTEVSLSKFVAAHPSLETLILYHNLLLEGSWSGFFASISPECKLLQLLAVLLFERDGPGPICYGDLVCVHLGLNNSTRRPNAKGIRIAPGFVFYFNNQFDGADIKNGLVLQEWPVGLPKPKFMGMWYSGNHRTFFGPPQSDSDSDGHHS